MVKEQIAFIDNQYRRGIPPGFFNMSDLRDMFEYRAALNSIALSYDYAVILFNFS